MPRKKREPVSSEILALLSPDRRRQVITEALGGQVREMFTRHRSDTLGKLVAALQLHRNWSAMQNIPVASVMEGKAGPAKAAGRAKAAAPAAAPAPSGPKGRHRRPGKGAKYDELLLKIIARSPGVRTEELKRSSGLPVEQVRPALARLRDSGRVKTKGIKRAMTYTIA